MSRAVSQFADALEQCAGSAPPRWCALGLLLIAALFAAPHALADDAQGAQSQGDVVQSTQELERVRLRIRDLSARVEKTHARKASLSGALKAAELQVADLLASLAKVQGDIAAQQRSVQRTEVSRDAAQREVAQQQSALGRQIRAAYQIGRQGRTKLLLNQQDPVAVGRVLTYYDYLARARSERIERFVQQARRLADLQRRLADELAALGALERDQQSALKAIERTRLERRAALDRLEERLSDETQALSQLQADEARLEDLLTSLRDLLADIPVELDRGKPFAQRRGELAWPVSGRRLLAGYGQPKTGSLTWKGIWVAGSVGDPVKAIAPGRVAYVGWMHRFGLMVIVEHDNDWYSLYGHTQRATRQVGEWVREGEVIAHTGNSGGHRDAGLYFELRRGARVVDPVAWLARR